MFPSFDGIFHESPRSHPRSSLHFRSAPRGNDSRYELRTGKTCHNRIKKEKKHTVPRLSFQYQPRVRCERKGAKNESFSPSKVLLMLVRGSLAFLRLSKAGNMRESFIMCPGNHDGGLGSGGRCAKTVTSSP